MPWKGKSKDTHYPSIGDVGEQHPNPPITNDDQPPSTSENPHNDTQHTSLNTDEDRYPDRDNFSAPGRILSGHNDVYDHYSACRLCGLIPGDEPGRAPGPQRGHLNYDRFFRDGGEHQSEGRPSVVRRVVGEVEKLAGHVIKRSHDEEEQNGQN